MENVSKILVAVCLVLAISFTSLAVTKAATPESTKTNNKVSNENEITGEKKHYKTHFSVTSKMARFKKSQGI